jgi:hypothetical protein
MTTTLADTLDQYEADQPPRSTTFTPSVMRRRAYMAGALAALTSKAPREQLLAECIQFGRAVGTKAEKSTL